MQVTNIIRIRELLTRDNYVIVEQELPALEGVSKVRLGLEIPVKVEGRKITLIGEAPWRIIGFTDEQQTLCMELLPRSFDGKRLEELYAQDRLLDPSSEDQGETVIDWDVYLYFVHRTLPATGTNYWCLTHHEQIRVLNSSNEAEFAPYFIVSECKVIQ